MAWIVGYLVVGLVSVAYAAWHVAREGDEVDPINSIIGCVAWPVFVAIVIGEMIAARMPLKDQPHD